MSAYKVFAQSRSWPEGEFMLVIGFDGMAYDGIKSQGRSRFLCALDVEQTLSLFFYAVFDVSTATYTFFLQPACSPIITFICLFYTPTQTVITATKTVCL